MGAYNMDLRRPPPPSSSIPPSGLKIWPADKSKPETVPTSVPVVPKPGDAAGAAAAAAAPPLHWREKQRRPTIGREGEVVHSLGRFMFGAAGAWAGLCLLFLLWWRPHWAWTGGGTGVGLAAGLLYSYLFYANKRTKEQTQQVLSQDPGLKGCQYLLGKLPNWISLTEREKMEWLNKLLTEVWPYYDAGVCDLVKFYVEPIMEYYRPPLIMKKIFFQELTFGEAPFRIEGITVRDLDNEIDMEVDVRWVGDANISLGIDLPVGGDFTRLCPKVKDIVFVGTLKILLRPLVEEIPGFAAVAVALKGPPIIKYRLDFGALPSTISTVVTSPIIAFVDFIVELVLGFFTWPNRMTIPVLGWNGWVFPKEDPVIDLEVERLAGRQQGVVRVHVVQAKELKSYDTLTGKSDPFVELFTTQDHRSKTRVMHNNLAPIWDEKLYLPVLENDTVLRVEMFDHDAVNLTSIKEMTALKAGKEFMGRAAIPLAQYIAEKGLEDEFWVPLGKGDWTNLEGPGRGEGLLKLGVQYRAVEDIAGEEIMRAQKGLLLVGVIRCFNLGGPKTVSYVQAKLTGSKETNKEECKTPVIRGDPNPRWTYDNKFTLYDVRAQDTLVVTVLSPSLVGADDELGRLEVPLSSIITSVQVSRWTKREQAGYLHDSFILGAGKATGVLGAVGGIVPLGVGGGGGGGSAGGGGNEPRIVLELEFLPYW